MSKCHCPTANIADNKMILSLPDAMTPVVWVMDMADVQGFVMRIEQTDNGLFVLQKVSSDGKKIEDIAYYPSRKKALKALTMITNSMKASGKSCCGGVWTYLKWFKNILVTVAALAILYIVASLVFGPMPLPMDEGMSQPPMMEEQSAPVPESDPSAVGVPMSADDFFEQNAPAGFPF